MKKLMIAAAAAAMVSGVQADIGGADITGTAYDVKVTLKTTVGTVKKATMNYYLGGNAAKNATKMWYDTATVKTLIAADEAAAAADKKYVRLWGKKTVSGKSIPCLTAAGKKDRATLDKLIAKNIPTTDKSGKNADGALYGFKSANAWCETFSIQDEVCYRTPGTVTISGILVDNCCMALYALAPDFIHAFGGVDYATSKKAEIWYDAAENLIGALVDKQYAAIAIVDSKKKDRVVNRLALAGQGVYGKVKENDGFGALVDKEGFTSLSGNAVGDIDQPFCDSCCVPGALLDVVWDCGTANNVAPVSYNTAAYGTFTIKYNASLTK